MRLDSIVGVKGSHCWLWSTVDCHGLPLLRVFSGEGPPDLALSAWAGRLARICPACSLPGHTGLSPHSPSLVPIKASAVGPLLPEGG